MENKSFKSLHKKRISIKYLPVIFLILMVYFLLFPMAAMPSNVGVVLDYVNMEDISSFSRYNYSSDDPNYQGIYTISTVVNGGLVQSHGMSTFNSIGVYVSSDDTYGTNGVSAMAYGIDEIRINTSSVEPIFVGFTWRLRGSLSTNNSLGSIFSEIQTSIVGDDTINTTNYSYKSFFVGQGYDVANYGDSYNKLIQSSYDEIINTDFISYRPGESINLYYMMQAHIQNPGLFDLGGNLVHFDDVYGSVDFLHTLELSSLNIIIPSFSNSLSVSSNSGADFPINIIENETNPVPEPSTFFLLFSGLAGLYKYNTLAKRKLL